ncbi:MAG TPA: glycosyl hydrolase [Streptosporangiaceae bacterium]|nr:glycosyl hydrolase [Streptosporangiaceae bacterium]
MTEPSPAAGHAAAGGRPASWFRAHATAVICVMAVLVVAVAFAVTRLASPAGRPAGREPLRYLGVYERSAPASYAGIDQFGQAIGKQPDLAPYYSSWGEPFQTAFAAAAAQHGAVPLVQINPAHIQLAAITAGRYDGYLRRFADAVRSYQRRVIVGFGHEPNGYWFTWGWQHSSAASFVAAWRHIVTVFRRQGAANITWLWTVNIIDTRGGIDPPGAWWPGASYVNWVGIDGYYYKPSWTFAPLFGPTLRAVRALTRDPVLISETAAGNADQPAKITNLFAGARAYGLLGFIWFNVDKEQNWQVTSPRAVAAFRRGAAAYQRPAP